jgi:NAD(P)-dependent dehydrogenase (short-subunit alcohol dehydrogenase family)
MKIVIIGASGTVGRAVTEELGRRHEVIRVGRTQGDYQVDITSQESVQRLFENIGPVDAIVSASGGLHFGPLATMKDSDFNQGLQDKLLGQVRLALTGQHYLNEGGSITLISGIVAHEPIAQGGMPSCGWLPVGQTGLAVRMIMRDGADELTDGFLVGMKRLQGVAS